MADHDSEPGGPGPVRDRSMDRTADNWPVQSPAEAGERDIEMAAAAAYLASLERGMPLSERRLAAMFGKTSRRWSRRPGQNLGSRPEPSIPILPADSECLSIQ